MDHGTTPCFSSASRIFFNLLTRPTNSISSVLFLGTGDLVSSSEHLLGSREDGVLHVLILLVVCESKKSDRGMGAHID